MLGLFSLDWTNFLVILPAGMIPNFPLSSPTSVFPGSPCL